LARAGLPTSAAISAIDGWVPDMGQI
jgi:hypothetical protein